MRALLAAEGNVAALRLHLGGGRVAEIEIIGLAVKAMLGGWNDSLKMR
jgi:hypothetical protein